MVLSNSRYRWTMLSSRLNQHRVSALELVTTSVVLTSWLSHTILQPSVHRRHNIRVGTSARLHRRLWWRPIHTPLITFWLMYACIQIFNFKHESIFSSMDCRYNQSASMNPHIHAMKLVNQRRAEYFFSASNKPARAYQHVLVLSTRRRGRSAGARLRHDTQMPCLSDIQHTLAGVLAEFISTEARWTKVAWVYIIYLRWLTLKICTKVYKKFVTCKFVWSATWRSSEGQIGYLPADRGKPIYFKITCGNR